jgi:hypothetical protein
MMFKIGIIVGIVIMCLVPTNVHNKIRSTAISSSIYVFEKLRDIAVEEQNYEIVKVEKSK